MKITFFDDTDSIVFETIGGFTPKLDKNLKAVPRQNIIEAGDAPFNIQGITNGENYSMWLQGANQKKPTEHNIKVLSIGSDYIIVEFI